MSEEEKPKCTREWHDSFGENYDDCQQCFIRDNGPWDKNPFLEPVPTGDDE